MLQTATILANALAGLSAPAAAGSTESSSDERPGFRTVVDADAEDERDELAAQRSLDAKTPGFATAVDVQQTPGARPADGLAEAVARTPGASTRSVGGLGQFSAVSLRGSSPQQVSVFLDGVPLGAALAGLVDLSDIPLDGLSRVEVYRGHVPISFGSAAIGGAINLVTDLDHGPTRLSAHGGGGSFGARQSGAAVSAPTTTRRGPGPRWTVRFGYAGSEGNFPYYDTSGTPQFTGDDRTSTRDNNGYDRVLGQVRLDGRRAATRWSVQELVVYKKRGEPGAASAPAASASAERLAARTIAAVHRDRFGSPGGTLSWVFGFGVQRRRFVDPDGEVGVATNDQTTLSSDLFVSPRLRLPLWRDAYVMLVADARPEWIDVDERAPAGAVRDGNARRFRFSTGAGVELQQFAWDSRILIAPAIRVDALANRFAVGPTQGEVDDEGRDDADVGIAPRVGARMKLLRWLELRASAGRYFRPPTLLELFGDQGYFVGNEGLRPERGTAVDGGVVFDLRRPQLDAYAQVAGFWTRSEDLIQWIAAGAVSRPENVGAAVVRGLETSAHVAPRNRAVTLTANYTLTDSADRTDDATRRGHPLPGRPRHNLFGRATTGWEWRVRGIEVEPRLLYTLDYIAANFLDPSGRFEVPRRALQGLGAELHLGRRVRLAVEVRNLLDVRTGRVTLPLARPTPITVPISDFLGYPLPGRSVMAQLEVATHLPPPPQTRRPR